LGFDAPVIADAVALRAGRQSATAKRKGWSMTSQGKAAIVLGLCVLAALLFIFLTREPWRWFN
jgi:hypothetical protein